MFFRRKPKQILTINDLLASKGIRPSGVAIMSMASIEPALARLAEDAVAEKRVRGLFTTVEDGTIFELLVVGKQLVAEIDASNSSIAGPMIVIQSVFEVKTGSVDEFAKRLKEAYE